VNPPHLDLPASTRIVEGEIRVFGSRTRYWEYGPTDAARTIVAVHGYRGDHHGLEPIVAHLGGIRVISPDLPGFGDSTPMTGERHSVEGYGRWLRGFLDALALTGRAVLLGHSFGSIVVAHAVADGLQTPAVILVNPITTDPAKVGGIAATRLFYAIGRRLPEGAARAWLGHPLVVSGMSVKLAKTRDRELRRFIHDQHRRYFSRFASRATVVEGFDASLSADVTAVASRLAMPVLLIAGERDEIAPLEGQRDAVGVFPDARLVVIPGVGHLIHYETPDAAADAIRAFLDGLG
jgi:pimeloyl-ACP methyl ester carboxylesterase